MNGVGQPGSREARRDAAGEPREESVRALGPMAALVLVGCGDDDAKSATGAALTVVATTPVVGDFAPLVSAAIVSFGSGRRDAATLDPDTVRAFLIEVLQRLRSQLSTSS